MATIDHVTLRASDLAASVSLFSLSFDVLDFGDVRKDADAFHEWHDFSVAGADAAHPPTRGVHVAFAAASRTQVDEWWRELTAAGYEDDGRPGPRPQYSASYYGAFVRDADGNSVEAVHHESVDRGVGLIDHLWIRVADLAPVKRFYGAVAEATGARVRDAGERLQVITEGGTFSLLEGVPTANLHLAIGVDDEATVRAFHDAALAAGGRDNGEPGERPQYREGYFGAYVLDPDGNNVEAVTC